MGFVENFAQRSFNKYNLPTFDGGNNGTIVAVDANGTDDKIDVLIVSKIYRIG